MVPYLVSVPPPAVPCSSFSCSPSISKCGKSFLMIGRSLLSCPPGHIGMTETSAPPLSTGTCLKERLNMFGDDTRNKWCLKLRLVHGPWNTISERKQHEFTTDDRLFAVSGANVLMVYRSRRHRRSIMISRYNLLWTIWCSQWTLTKRSRNLTKPSTLDTTALLSI